jgi:hypothetical protein
MITFIYTKTIKHCKSIKFAQLKLLDLSNVVKETINFIYHKEEIIA